MEEAFAADPPEGLKEKAHGAALAWTPPGFAPFDTGRVEEAVEDDPPAEETGPEANDGETPDAAPATLLQCEIRTRCRW